MNALCQLHKEAFVFGPLSALSAHQRQNVSRTPMPISILDISTAIRDPGERHGLCQCREKSRQTTKGTDLGVQLEVQVPELGRYREVTSGSRCCTGICGIRWNPTPSTSTTARATATWKAAWSQRVTRGPLLRHVEETNFVKDNSQAETP